MSKILTKEEVDRIIETLNDILYVGGEGSSRRTITDLLFTLRHTEQEAKKWFDLHQSLTVYIAKVEQERDEARSESKAWIRKCEEFGKSMADFAVADEERQLRHREHVAKLEAEVDELRLQNKILSANREADEKDIVALKAENERLRKAIDTHWYVETEDGTKCFYCGEEVIDEDENYKPKHPEVPDLLGAVVCIVLKCQPKVTQVNLDTDSTIDESGGRKGDETIEAAGKT